MSASISLNAQRPYIILCVKLLADQSETPNDSFKRVATLGEQRLRSPRAGQRADEVEEEEEEEGRGGRERLDRRPSVGLRAAFALLAAAPLLLALRPLFLPVGEAGIAVQLRAANALLRAAPH